MKMTCNMPDHAAVVDAMLEGFVRACQVIVESGLAPPDPAETNVRYQLEGKGEEDWKLPQNVMRDGWGDCEDLAAWRAAGLRSTGEDPGARCVVTETGPHKLHAVVQRSDGSIDDPSRELYQRQGGKGGRVGDLFDIVTNPASLILPHVDPGRMASQAAFGSRSPSTALVRYGASNIKKGIQSVFGGPNAPKPTMYDPTTPTPVTAVPPQYPPDYGYGYGPAGYPPQYGYPPDYGSPNPNYYNQYPPDYYPSSYDDGYGGYGGGDDGAYAFDDQVPASSRLFDPSDVLRTRLF